MPFPSSLSPWRSALVAASLCLSATAAVLPSASPAAAATDSSQASELQISSTGAPVVKHVWLIILENKSYDASFTGLNKNSYLWQTLPQQGVLLKNYFGTGHFSQDNYEAMVSGQAPEQDLQSDCDVAATNFSRDDLIEKNGTLQSNPNFGQAVSAAGPNAADGKNGCVYPPGVSTLFNQLDAAGKSWKGYAQDLGAQPGRDDGPCGYPGTATNSPDAVVDSGTTTHKDSTALNAPKNYAGVRSFTGTQAAGNDAAGNPGALEDGYVAKHFPFPWFHSLTDNAKDCDAAHIANLDSSTNGLFHDLQDEATTPAFSWITPNNCSDAHDAICKGNNLSGAFKSDGSPDYTGVTPAYDPQHTTPVNYTGGLYASDLFLKWYVPLIEQSAAFKDGGLIDVTFDEANPAFANSSFNNASDPAFAPDAANSDPAFASNGGHVSPGVVEGATLSSFLAADAAGQNINGKDVSTEPAGPNTPLTYQADGKTPNPGPGDNGFIDRKPSGGRTDGAAAAVSVSSTNPAVINDNSIAVGDAGRAVTSTDPGIPAAAPCPCYVGPVSDVGPLFPTAAVNATGGGLVPAASAVAGSFTLVDANGNPVPTTGPVTSVALAALTTATDRLYDPTDFTPGGGDTGSVLISPFIKPGSVSSTFYNHYSWLRSMEDELQVKDAAPGLDGLGHLGYAAQEGLTPFGADVFTNLPPHSTGKPSLSGDGRVGSVETCSPGTWDGSPSFSYRWTRDGALLDAPRTSSYRLVGSDYRHQIACVVTATSSAGSTTATTASLSPAVGPKVVSTHPSSLRGTLKVGSRIQTTGTVTNPRATSLPVQWYRNGHAIPKANQATYLLTAADRGQLISARITLVSTGYTTGLATTPSGRVK